MRAEAQEGKANGTKREPKLQKEGTRERHQSGSSGRGNANKEGGHKGKERKRLEPGEKKEGSGKNRKLTIIMGLINTHFTKGKTYIKIHSPLKSPGVVRPPLHREEIPNAAPCVDGESRHQASQKRGK